MIVSEVFAEESTPMPQKSSGKGPDKSGSLDGSIGFLRDIIILIILALVMREFFISPFKISGSSMEESYHDGEFLLVNKISYQHAFGKSVGEPKRGDVVILRPHAKNGKEYYIKRVIGLPGDTLSFRDGDVYVKKSGAKEAVKISEPYLSAFNRGRTSLPPDVTETSFTVPAGEYFVMGDNRNNSSDSRSCFMSCSIGDSTHFIKRDDVVGKVFLDFGNFQVFENFPFNLTFAKQMGWVTPPRFLSTPREWTYPELEAAE